MMSKAAAHDASREEEDLRRGPWTVEEDLLLVNYIAARGEGRWNALARSAGLRRTGKSCRLRWLNYLRPDLRRGSFTAQEQVVILELHARWGNRWSKIAQHLPGRTDNEIKNYWRTRVHKHARHLNCDVGSQQFRDLVRYLWMPRLLELVHADDHGAAPPLHQPADVDLSCCTAAAVSTSSSSSCVSTPAPQPQHQLSPLPAPPVPCAESAFLVDDTSPQAPHAHHQQHELFLAQLDTPSWPDESSSLLAGVYDDDNMAMALPDIGDTMWGAGADDLWYTQMMGL